MITDLDIAHNVLIFAETFEVLVHVLDTLNTESETLWLKVWDQKFVAFFDEDIDLLSSVAVLGERAYFSDSFVHWFGHLRLDQWPKASPVFIGFGWP